MIPFNLTCEFLENPIGIDTVHPRLGWQFLVKSDARDKHQSAYKILVSSSKIDLDNNIGDLWDSGKVITSQSQHVEYHGKELKSRMDCYWKVKAWDEGGNESQWSGMGSWRVGILPGDWQGRWIGARERVSYEDRFPVSTDLLDCPEWIKPAARREHPHGPGPENDFAMAVYLRKEFTTSKQVTSAHVTLAGLGYHELSLNGEKAGDRVLDPGATDYSKSVLYVTRDVTRMIRAGKNCIGITLGNGWFWVGTPDLFGFENAGWAAPPRCLLELQLKYVDGSEEFIRTDSTWTCSERGPIRFNCIRSGEVYDARLEMPGWDAPGFVGTGEGAWHDSIEVEAPAGTLRSQIAPPIKTRRKYSPIKRVLLENGSLVFWFPKNNAGWVEISVKGKVGQVIKIEMNEKLNDGGSVDMQIHSGHTFGRYQTCEYTCKGSGIETWHPVFCYAGFQYVQVTGALPEEIVEILAVQVCTAFEQTGEFQCSNLVINSINEASKLTFMNAFHSYPEDCPQREKAGWTEDGLISAHGSVYNFDGLLAYEKWIRDLVDAQHEASGQVPDIVPTPSWGKPTEIHPGRDYTPFTREELGNMADPWWGGALVMLPWKLYEHYGDMRILKESYAHMKRYVDLLLRTTRYDEDEYSYLIDWPTILGDWLEIGSGGSASRTPRLLTCTQGFYRCATIIAEVAALLGLESDAEKYSRVSARIHESFNEEFFNKETGLYWKDSQSAQAMSLALGLVPRGREADVLERLVENVLGVRSGHLSTGIVGTYFLYKALSQYGRPDLAFKVITAKSYPGFEHMLTRVDSRAPLPSTCLWEDWAGRFSLAHPVQGSVVSYFYEYLAGIKPVLDAPGFKRVDLEPIFIESLDWVKARYNSIHGDIVSEWNKEEGRVTLYLQIPANVSATVTLPISRLDRGSIDVDGHSLDSAVGISDIQPRGRKTRFRLGSGRYHISFLLERAE
ncbi:MAG: family 78 glycoside hydrolase catalytic domain [Promethearchaeota archaeon]